MAVENIGESYFMLTKNNCRLHPSQITKHYWQKMLAITAPFVMYKFSITPYMHVQVCSGLKFFLLQHLPIKLPL